MRAHLAVAAATLLVLAAAPAADLWLSALFFDGARFPLAGAPVAEAVRQAIWWLAILLFLASAALAPLAALRGPILMPAREWAWGALVFLLGPGIAVNGLLKELWGRARPRAVETFGGQAEFTPWWRPAAECASNCSFVSGEASAGAAIAVILWAWLSPRFPGAPLAAALLSLRAAAGLLRLAKGAHFASDVVMAWALTAILAIALRRAMGLAAR